MLMRKGLFVFKSYTQTMNLQHYNNYCTILVLEAEHNATFWFEINLRYEKWLRLLVLV